MIRPARIRVSSTILRGHDEWTVTGTVDASENLEVELEEATGPRGEVHDWTHFRHWPKRDVDTAEQRLIDTACAEWERIPSGLTERQEHALDRAGSREVC